MCRIPHTRSLGSYKKAHKIITEFIEVFKLQDPFDPQHNLFDHFLFLTNNREENSVQFVHCSQNFTDPCRQLALLGSSNFKLTTKKKRTIFNLRHIINFKWKCRWKPFQHTKAKSLHFCFGLLWFLVFVILYDHLPQIEFLFAYLRHSCDILAPSPGVLFILRKKLLTKW